MYPFFTNNIGGDHPWEWAGVFAMPQEEASTWTFEKVGGAYADATMEFCWLSTSSNDAASLESQEEAAEACRDAKDDEFEVLSLREWKAEEAAEAWAEAAGPVYQLGAAVAELERDRRDAGGRACARRHPEQPLLTEGNRLPCR